MALGEKLRQERLRCGMSQKQLCGEKITRNMLSQIENGSASPSLDTLRYLARQLGRPVSFFLEEDPVEAENYRVLGLARRYYDTGDWANALGALEACQGPDPVLDREKALLTALCRLHWAQELMDTGRRPYAREILRHTETQGLYCQELLERQRLLLLGQLEPVTLPSLDGELLIRAALALAENCPEQAGRLLDAAQDRNCRWHWLRGQCYMKLGQFRQAVDHLHQAEPEEPETLPALELCYRELGDFRQAYEYACKQRK